MGREKVLITVKTYPTLSRKHGELVCTAGVREDGSWVRVYPIPFRLLDYKDRYQKFDWIEARLVRNAKDPRPETFHLADTADIQQVGRMETMDNWRERRDLMLKQAKVYDRLEPLIDAAHANQLSLAVFKPTKILDFVWESDDRKSDQSKVDQMNQRISASISGSRIRHLTLNPSPRLRRRGRSFCVPCVLLRQKKSVSIGVHPWLRFFALNFSRRFSSRGRKVVFPVRRCVPRFACGRRGVRPFPFSETWTPRNSAGVRSFHAFSPWPDAACEREPKTGLLEINFRTNVTSMSAVELAVRKVKKLSARQAKELLGWLDARQSSGVARSSQMPRRKAAARHRMKKLLAWHDSVRLTTDWEPPRMPDDLVKPFQF